MYRYLLLRSLDVVEKKSNNVNKEKNDNCRIGGVVKIRHLSFLQSSANAINQNVAISKVNDLFRSLKTFGACNHILERHQYSRCQGVQVPFDDKWPSLNIHYFIIFKNLRNWGLRPSSCQTNRACPETRHKLATLLPSCCRISFLLHFTTHFFFNKRAFK